jgi:hypothetical protein
VGVAGGQQHPRDDVDRLLGAVGDHDVLGGRLHPAGNADVSGDRLTQARVPGRVAVAAAADGVGAQLPGQQPPPRLIGEQPPVGDAGTKVELGRVLEHDRDRDGVPDRPRAQRTPGPPGRAGGGLEAVADEGPGPNAGGEEPSPTSRS